jgi:hypothetical protein
LSCLAQPWRPTLPCIDLLCLGALACPAYAPCLGTLLCTVLPTSLALSCPDLPCLSALPCPALTKRRPCPVLARGTALPKSPVLPCLRALPCPARPCCPCLGAFPCLALPRRPAQARHPALPLQDALPFHALPGHPGSAGQGMAPRKGTAIRHGKARCLGRTRKSKALQVAYAGQGA